jgi:hypothetical protein
VEAKDVVRVPRYTTSREVEANISRGSKEEFEANIRECAAGEGGERMDRRS